MTGGLIEALGEYMVSKVAGTLPQDVAALRTHPASRGFLFGWAISLPTQISAWSVGDVINWLITRGSFQERVILGFSNAAIDGCILEPWSIFDAAINRWLQP